jgi:hypothetical protein
MGNLLLKLCTLRSHLRIKAISLTMTIPISENMHMWRLFGRYCHMSDTDINYVLCE